MSKHYELVNELIHENSEWLKDLLEKERVREAQSPWFDEEEAKRDDEAVERLVSALQAVVYRLEDGEALGEMSALDGLSDKKAELVSCEAHEFFKQMVAIARMLKR